MGVVTTLVFSSTVLGYLISIVRYGEKINGVSLLGVIAIVVGIVGIVSNKSKPK